MPGTAKYHVIAWRITTTPSDAVAVKLAFQRQYALVQTEGRTTKPEIRVFQRNVRASGITIGTWVIVARVARRR